MDLGMRRATSLITALITMVSKSTAVDLMKNSTESRDCVSKAIRKVRAGQEK